MPMIYWLGEPQTMTSRNAGLPAVVQPTVWAGDDFASAWRERLTRPVKAPSPESVLHSHTEACLGPAYDEVAVGSNPLSLRYRLCTLGHSRQVIGYTTDYPDRLPRPDRT